MYLCSFVLDSGLYPLSTLPSSLDHIPLVVVSGIEAELGVDNAGVVAATSAEVGSALNGVEEENGPCPVFATPPDLPCPDRLFELPPLPPLLPPAAFPPPRGPVDTPPPLAAFPPPLVFLGCDVGTTFLSNTTT